MTMLQGTPNYGFPQIPIGSVGWGKKLNDAFVSLDALLKSMVEALADEVEARALADSGVTEQYELALEAARDDLTEAIDGVQTLAAAFAIGSNPWLIGNVNNITYGSITRDGNGAATSATVTWPDGTTGAYTATTVSTAFPGAVDAYTVTYVKGGVTKTVTQPAVTRDPVTGAVTAQPALTVATS